MSKFAILVAALAAASCSAFTASPQSSVQGDRPILVEVAGVAGGAGCDARAGPAERAGAARAGARPDRGRRR